MTDRVDINRLLVEMRAMKSQTQAFQRPAGLAPRDVGAVNNTGPLRPDGSTTKVPGFGEIMSQAINKVNDVQQASSAMATAYEKGDAGVDITDVMIASQKASVSFQAMVQVRNKLVDAYRDVMNMPV
jgi:flagellar hook-basal body complex protein FliE